MIEAVTAVAFLGREVRIADSNVLIQRAEVVALRRHPVTTADYMVELDNGMLLTGSDLRILETPLSEGDNE